MNVILILIGIGIISSFFLKLEKKINSLKKYPSLKPVVPFLQFSLTLGLIFVYFKVLGILAHFIE